MQTAIATDYLTAKPTIVETERTLALIAKSGFSHIHWTFEWGSCYIYSKHEIQQIREMVAKYHLKVKGVHASDGAGVPYEDKKLFFSNIEYNRLSGVELIKNRIDLANALDTDVIVLHAYLYHKFMPEYAAVGETFYQQLFKTLDELKDYCKAKGVRIAVETLSYPDLESQFEEFDAIMARYNKDYIGICYDVGHGALRSPENHTEFADRYKDRILMTHCHDNNGSVDNTLFDECYWKDLHTNPFAGIINWDKVVETIATSPYELPLVLESMCYIDKETEEDFLNEAYRCAVKLTEMVNKIRN